MRPGLADASQTFSAPQSVQLVSTTKLSDSPGMWRTALLPFTARDNYDGLSTTSIFVGTIRSGERFSEQVDK